MKTTSFTQRMPLIHRFSFHFSKFGFRGASKLWRFALALRPYPSGWVQLPDGYILKVDTSDWNKTSIYKGLYDRPLCKLVANLNFKGSFIDVGSNIGYVGFLACFGKSLDCLSFEPIVNNLEHQTKVFSHLKLRFQAINLAISDNDGIATLYGGNNPHHSGAASLHRSDLSDFGSNIVQISTLNSIALQKQFLRYFKSQFLVKIDTEGAEGRVIAGMSSLVSLPQFLGMIIEVSPNFGSIEYLRDLNTMLGKTFKWILIKESRKFLRYKFVAELIDWNDSLTLKSQENLVLVKDLRTLGNIHVA